MIRALAAIALAAWPGLCAALELDLPSNARLLASRDSAPDSYALPTGAHDGTVLPAKVVAGAVTRRAWRIDTAGATTLQLLEPLRRQLAEAGFKEVFSCATEACGGFDFRYRTEVFPAPDMHVDLDDYRFVSASRTTADGEEYVGLLVSRSAAAGFVQLIAVSPADIAPLAVTANTEAPVTEPAPPGSLGSLLEANGHAALEDLTFATGSSDLGEMPFASLQALADYLKANPSRRVALVGHTDSQGALDRNIALSRRRAQSVRKRLLDAHGIPAAQVDAEGMGYLAPIATNLTPEGREANRRVEVVLLNTE